MKEAWGEEDNEEVKAVALYTLQRTPLNDSLLIKLDVLKLHCSLVYQRVRTKPLSHKISGNSANLNHNISSYICY